MPYRNTLDFPPVDREELAIQTLAARAARLRRNIIFPSVVVGLVGAVAGYLLVRALQFAMMRAQIPWVSGVVGGLPPLLASLRIAQKLGDTVVRRRAPAWIEEQTRMHELETGVLDDYKTVL